MSARLMIAEPSRAIRDGLERQSTALLDYSLDVFLDIDFLDHTILDGRLTPGHIVTYLAREADRMADEVLAGTGQPVPAPDRGRRWEISEGGNERPGAVMVDDIHESTLRLREALAGVDDWATVPASVRSIPAHRLVQLVVHLIDLGRGWDALEPEDALVAASVAAEVLHPELSGFRLDVADVADVPSGLIATREGDGVVVSGAPAALLAWATGRTTNGLHTPIDFPTPPLRIWI